MSQTIASVFVILAAQVLPLFGVQIDSSALTTTIATVITIGAGIWIWVRRVKVGDVKAFGGRK